MHLRYIITLIAFSAFHMLYGQGYDNSPYSRFGLGDPVNNNLFHSRQMGGLGAAYNDPYHINIVNPASYSRLRAISFDLGVYGQFSSLSSEGQSDNVSSGNIEYISFGIPLSNPVNEILEREERNYSLSMAFTLMPHTRVGYNISSFEDTENFGTIERNFRGEGGSFKFLWGNSVRYKDFSFGINLGYLFGKINYERNVLYDPSEFAFNNLFTTEYSLSGALYNVGFLYSGILNKKQLEERKNVNAKRLSVGIHFGSQTSFSTKGRISEIALQQVSSNQVISDTLRFVTGLEGQGTLPGELGLGLMYNYGEKYSIGANYSTTFWSQYENDLNPSTLSDARTISLGGSFRPNFQSQDSYWDRVYYRAGVYHTKDPRTINNEAVSSYGINFGLGLPFIYQRKISHANLGLELGRRGQNTAITESYLRVTLGFNFNDTDWFLKRKYD